jgi:aminoglycoside phosphotransferase (APT) family kinase protein
MKINPTDRCLSLLLKALDETIIPELQTQSAQATAGIMKNTLSDLLKREHGTREILGELIASGEKLVADMSAELKLPAPVLSEADEPGFSALAKHHEQLTAKLVRLCKQLAARPGTAAAPLLRRAAEWEYEYYRRTGELPIPELDFVEHPGDPLSPDALQDFLNSVRTDEQGPVTINSFKPLSGGFGKQTFLCEYLDKNKVVNDLVIRKTDPTPIMQHGACILENEYALLRALAATGYPAPEPLDFANGWQNVDGSFYTMEKIRGEVPGGFLDGLKGKLSQQVFFRLAELLARLHTTPLDTFTDYINRYDNPGILGGTIEDCYTYNLEAWAAYMEREEHLASPYVNWMMSWLKANIPRDSRAPVLVHGDFNIHNILLDAEEVTAVLDWECAEFASPEQDLAYIQPHISQHVDWQKFVDHYVASGGQPLNPECMSFGLVYSTIRVHLGGNRATRNLQRGINDDIRYVMPELGFIPTFMSLGLNSVPG